MSFLFWREEKESTARFQKHLQRIETFQADLEKRSDTNVKKLNSYRMKKCTLDIQGAFMFWFNKLR